MYQLPSFKMNAKCFYGIILNSSSRLQPLKINFLQLSIDILLWSILSLRASRKQSVQVRNSPRHLQILISTISLSRVNCQNPNKTDCNAENGWELQAGL